jgi:hypothetical protein
MIEMNASSGPVSLQKYILQFAGVYILCSIVIFAITSVLNFEVPSSMGIVTLIASTAPVMQSFVKRENRMPLKSERVNFASLATAVSLLLSVIFVAALCAVYQLNPLDVLQALEIPLWAIAAMLLFAAGLSWVVIYFFSGFMAKQTMKQIEKAKLK